MRSRCALVLVVAVLCSGAAWADTTTYSFGCITNLGSAQCTTGETFLSLDVIGAGQSFDFGTGGTATTDATDVLFRFYLSPDPGLATLSITDVYFDDGSLLAMGSRFQTTGVVFDSPATPADLPGGNNLNPPFQTTDQWSADSTSPVMPNGVNHFGESLGIMFSLQTGRTYGDVLDELQSGALRVGIHVQDISPGGGSLAFVNNPAVPPPGVPEPATMLLVGSALLSVGFLKRRLSH